VSGWETGVRGNEAWSRSDVGLDRLWDAVKDVAGESGWVVRMELTQKSNARAVMVATDNEGLTVAVHLEARAQRITGIRVRVGDVGSERNGARAEAIVRQIISRL
jgi:hypothetical protein